MRILKNKIKICSSNKIGPSHIHPKNLLGKLFGDNLIQNLPHSPDIAYPIKNLDEIKLITIEEWNKITKYIIRKKVKK